MDLVLRTRSGAVHELSLDIAPGFPGSPLSEAQHQQRFDDCLTCAPWPLAPAQAQVLRSGIDALPTLEVALPLFDAMLAPAAAPR